MNEHDVFISADRPASVVRAAIEAAFGAALTLGPDPESVPALVTGTSMVFFHDYHPFEDDTDFPVTRYTCWVNVRDTARNTETPARDRPASIRHRQG